MFSRKTQNRVFRNVLQRVGLWRLTSPKTCNKLWAGSRETDLFSVFMWTPENQESWQWTFILKADRLKTQKEPLSKSTSLPPTNIQIPMSQIPIQRLSGRILSFLKVLEGRMKYDHLLCSLLGFNWSVKSTTLQWTGLSSTNMWPNTWGFCGLFK